MNSTQPLDDRTAKCLGCGSTGPVTPCSWCQDAEAIKRYCAGCGEPEGSYYAKHCCTEDNMIDDGGEEE